MLHANQTTCINLEKDCAIDLFCQMFKLSLKFAAQCNAFHSYFMSSIFVKITMIVTAADKNAQAALSPCPFSVIRSF